MSAIASDSFSGFRNLGLRSKQMLKTAGILSAEQLQKTGSVAAFFAVQQSAAPAAQPSLNLLWALEGALSCRDWKEIANDSHTKLALLMQLDDLKKQTSSTPPTHQNSMR